MVCQRVPLLGGGHAIVCGPRARRRKCAECGRPADLLCDARLKGKAKTCDRPICDRCTTSPAEGKDLCPEHARAYERWLATRADQP